MSGDRAFAPGGGIMFLGIAGLTVFVASVTIGALFGLAAGIVTYSAGWLLSIFALWIIAGVRMRQMRGK